MEFQNTLLSQVTIVFLKLDWCRVVSRRAERRCVTWKELNKLEDSFVITYLNRLSDLLWMMARDNEDEWTASK